MVVVVVVVVAVVVVVVVAVAVAVAVDCRCCCFKLQQRYPMLSHRGGDIMNTQEIRGIPSKSRRRNI